MGIVELNSRVSEIRELKRMAAELQEQIDSMTDEIKQELVSRGVDELSGIDWKVTYKAVTSTRLDTTALKKSMPEIVERFTKTTTTRRFCIV